MSDNPYKSAETETPPPPGKRPLFTPAGVILGLVAIGIVAFLLLPQVRSARGPAERSLCTSNMKQIVLGLLRYEEEHGTLPPAYTVDDEGNRLHSWRTLILPYLDQQELYDQIDLTRPWDDPVNATAREALVNGYICPASPGEEELTTYLAVIGPDSPFSGATGKRSGDIKAGVANSIVVIDASADDAVHWMSPEDISIDDLLGYDGDTRIHHVGQVVYGMLDGSVHSIHLATEVEKFRALLRAQPLPAQ